MEDKYGYKDVKKIFDERKSVKNIKNDKRIINEEKQHRFQYEKKNYSDSINDDVYVFATKGDFEVKEKEVLKEKTKLSKEKALKIAAVTLGIASVVATGAVLVVNAVNHPEWFLTTHPDFVGPPSFSELIREFINIVGKGGR